MKVVFRVDASDSIASGHVTRCLTLAAALRRRGAECVFVSRQVSGNLFSSVVGAGFEQRVLPGSGELLTRSETSEEHRQSIVDDAIDTIAALSGERPRWMVIDHYAIGDEWERLLRPHVDSILVIDDLANREHHCDVLLDQNFSLIGEQRYADLVRRDTRLLCGPRYAMLQPEFARYRATLDRPRSNQIRAFVSFGGSDRDNLTGLTLEAFQTPDFADIALDVAIGRNNPHRDHLERLIAERPGARAHIAPQSLAPLMAKADFAVGAGGTTTWERLCLDLPSIVIALAENQVPTCESLDAAGRIEYVGDWASLTLSDLRDATMRVVDRLKDAGASSSEPLVDGLGADRVAEVMAPAEISTLVMRPATRRDIDSYFAWVNDPEIRTQSLSTAPVAWAEHQRWFTGKITADDTLMLVLESSELPIGQVRFDFGEGGAVLDYSLDSIARGRGLGPILVRKGLEQLSRRNPVTVSAAVRTRNSASAGAFVGAGFMLDRPTHGEPLRISIVSDQASWINDSLVELFLQWIEDGHVVAWSHDVHRVPTGDLCFYLSCGQLASAETLARFKHNLVVHESELPLGRGWSPLSWQILSGASDIAVTLFEAASTVDSGDIYAQQWLHFDGTELVNELRAAQAAATISLCKDFVKDYPRSAAFGRPQEGKETRYRRRTPADSTLEPHLSLAEQFDLLRIVDNERYPATLEIRGAKYRVAIERATD